jgi:hypothetical protein
MNTMTNMSIYSMKVLFIRYIKYDSGLVNPKDIIVYSYRPYLKNESNLRYVTFSDFQLMIFRSKIDLGKDTYTHLIVDQTYHQS